MSVKDIITKVSITSLINLIQEKFTILEGDMKNEINTVREEVEAFVPATDDDIRKAWGEITYKTDMFDTGVKVQELSTKVDNLETQITEDGEKTETALQNVSTKVSTLEEQLSGISFEIVDGNLQATYDDGQD